MIYYKDVITRLLIQHQQQRTKLIADYCNIELDLYRNPDTLKYYEKMENGYLKKSMKIELLIF